MAHERPFAPRAALAAASFCAALACLFAVDRAFARWSAPTGHWAYLDRLSHEGSFKVVDDPLVGYRPMPSQRGRDVETFGGRRLSAVYTIDAFARRLVPGQTDGRRTRPLLFFGCSFAFGQDVGDDQTLPYYVSRRAPRRRVYDYGFAGWDPQEALALLEKGDLRAQVPEKGKPAAIYLLIGDQVRRVAGALSWEADEHTPSLPYYAATPGGLELRGSFAKARPVRALLFKLAARSGIVRHFGLDWPPAITDADIEKTADLILQAKKTFQAKFGSDEFYVVGYPAWPMTDTRRVLELLRAQGVRCLDYTELDLPKIIGEPAMFPDYHPVPKAYEAVARLLARDLGLDESSGLRAAATSVK